VKTLVIKVLRRLGLTPIISKILTTIGLPSVKPIEKVFRELRKRDVNPGDLHALEVFGREGDWQTQYYARDVSTLDVWEINPEYETALRQNLPDAELKITDSYEEMRNTSRRYNLIVVDNQFSFSGEHCEHFDFFPDIFRICMDLTILVLRVILEVDDSFLRAYPYVFNDRQLAQRGSFYKTNHPEKLSFGEMIGVYKDLALANGFVVGWYFFQPQERFGCYWLTLKIKRQDL